MSQRVSYFRSKSSDLETGSFPTPDGGESRRSQSGWTQSALYASIAEEDDLRNVYGDDDGGYDELGAQTGRQPVVQAAPTVQETSAIWGDDEIAPAPRNDGIDAPALWRKTLGELQLQLASSTYYTWLHNTWIEAYEDGDLIVGTANTYARDWLDNRLKSIIRRTLKSIAGRTLEVRFVVSARQPGVRENQPETLQSELSPAIPISKARESDLARQSVPASNDELAALFADAPTVPAPSRTTTAPRQNPAGLQLNPLYTFGSFVVGSNNRLATAAAQAVAERPGFKFNPLFVHGGVGLGKTHLLHAIGNELIGKGLNVLYVTSEQFTNDLIGAIRTQSTDQFRNRYRALDVLLIDDIQFIAGKESTQEEVFHTFNHLQQLGKQVVLSSDRPPRSLQLLEERLRSRFEGGIRVDVSAPDYETRVAILQSKAQRMGIHVETEVLSLVAQRVDSNIRELEGALNHLFLQAQMERTQLDMAMAASSLAHVAPHRKPCDPARLIEIVARHQHLLPEDITGARRTKSVADARHLAMYLLREDSALSLPQIGALFGGRDHSTVAHGVAKITTELRRDEQLRATVAALRERIYS